MMSASAATRSNELIEVDNEIVAIVEEARRLGLPKKKADKLLGHFASTQATIEKKTQRIAELQEELKDIKEKNKNLRKKIRDLKATPRKTSRNSGLPPSSDPPSVPRRRKREPSKRKPGGQPGHKGNSRILAPKEKVDKIVDIYPDKCTGCGKEISEGEKLKDPNPTLENRHQIIEIPEIKSTITEFRRQKAKCGGCKAVIRANFPENITRSAFGPNLMALVVFLTGAYYMSKRNVASLLSSVFGIAISLGTISNIEHRVSKALRLPIQLFHDLIRKAREAYADETAWKQCARRVYLWVVVTSIGAIFYVSKSRAAIVAMNMLGESKKIIVTDRYRGYDWIPLDWRQICWSHLKRDFEWLSEFPGAMGKIGRELLDWEKELFVLWDRVKAGKLKRSTFKRKVAPIKKKIRSLLQEGEALKVRRASGMCKEMLKVYKAFYTFVYVEDVEPTNNTAERTVRGGAIWRRLSYGTWSIRGSEYVGRILTVVATLKIQKRPILPYLQEVCAAVIEGKPAPLLMPMESEKESSVKAA